MSYNKTIPSVNRLPAERVIGPTKVNVKIPVIKIENNGVNRLSKAEGITFLKNVSILAKIKKRQEQVIPFPDNLFSQFQSQKDSKQGFPHLITPDHNPIHLIRSG